MKRNKFSLSHHKLLTANQGGLYPIACYEVLPGDSIQQATSALLRTTPLLAPMYANVDIRIHHWFVPNRLIWTAFEDFITGGPDGEDATVFPHIELDLGIGSGTLGDYLGLPLAVAANTLVSVLPFRAYNLIWNEWYRDQDLQTELTISKASGLDVTTGLALQNCAWEKDYFTSARPWAQKGPEVTIPLTGTADIVATGPFKTLLGATEHLWQSTNTQTTVAINPAATTTGSHNYASGLEVDLSDATIVGINDLREAFALQRYAEARSRYGSRYTEYLRYLGVRSPDARLQRPEYLGGGRQRLQISEVLQTGVTTDGDDSEGVGNLKGHGIGAVRSNRFRRFFEEHGLVMSLLSVKPRTVYSQGIPKMWYRRTKEDYYQQELAHIGQAEILKREVYAASASDSLDATWGYQDRYDEYRRIESSVAGEFRIGKILNYWHMGREFSAAPLLNSDFVKANPTDRVYSVGESVADTLQIVCNHSIQARRMLPKTGTSFIM